jgi:hypothetical protein
VAEWKERVFARLGRGSAEQIMKAGLHFIRLAGSFEAARERLVGLERPIETAKDIDSEVPRR